MTLDTSLHPEAPLQAVPNGRAMARAVVVLSGGLDSTVAMAEILNHLPASVALAITFDYGQRAALREIDAASAIAKHYGIAHRVVSLPWLSTLVPADLNPETSSAGLSSATADSVWVPNRNGVFLNIAASYAEMLDAQAVIFGANLEEAEAGFPDNSEMYRIRLNTALDLSTRNKVRVMAPVGHLTKSQIGQRAAELNIPLHLVWSCYDQGKVHCGLCPSCQLLKKALSAANLTTCLPFAQ
ncbi:MAG: 7-cyano-7-deazaguanine synthase QueC [Vampirovibrionales bacterium]|nr:7-cyano-7-deazaguanine synthase QueC [Vampirovibrionales bacterium]